MSDNPFIELKEQIDEEILEKRRNLKNRPVEVLGATGKVLETYNEMISEVLTQLRDAIYNENYEIAIPHTVEAAKIYFSSNTENFAVWRWVLYQPKPFFRRAPLVEIFIWAHKDCLEAISYIVRSEDSEEIRNNISLLKKGTLVENIKAVITPS